MRKVRLFLVSFVVASIGVVGASSAQASNEVVTRPAAIVGGYIWGWTGG